jgi:POT family proton-dependent oligopeptide transporter
LDLPDRLVPVREFGRHYRLAPIIAATWVKLAKRNSNPSIPRKFGLGILFNAAAFGLLMFALSSLVGTDSKIPFWTLFMVYVIQSVGELCLSPIGLSMVTKLAPVRAWWVWAWAAGSCRPVSATTCRASSPRIASGESGMSVVIRTVRLHDRLLDLDDRRRDAVPDRTADPES